MFGLMFSGARVRVEAGGAGERVRRGLQHPDQLSASSLLAPAKHFMDGQQPTGTGPQREFLNI